MAATFKATPLQVLMLEVLAELEPHEKMEERDLYAKVKAREPKAVNLPDALFSLVTDSQPPLVAMVPVEDKESSYSMVAIWPEGRVFLREHNKGKSPAVKAATSTPLGGRQ